MPSSVGMRRTTRVFGVVKGGDTSSVLRSGRRLWPDSGDENREGDESAKRRKLDEDDDDEDDDIGLLEMVKKRNRRAGCMGKQGGCDKHFGIVYSRKRKRSSTSTSTSITIANEVDSKRQKNRCVFAINVVKNGDIDLFSCLIFRLLSRLMMRLNVTTVLKDLSAFLLYQPVSTVYASRGIHCLQGNVIDKVGICQFFGITRFMPLFSVDFSAVPHCFQYLHSTLLLRYNFRSYFLVLNRENVPSNVEKEVHLPISQSEQWISCNSHNREVIEINDGLSLPASGEGDGSSVRNGQHQKKNSKRVGRKRASSGRKKARNPSTKNIPNNGALGSDTKDGGKESIAVVASNKKPRNSTNGCAGLILSEANSAMLDSREALMNSSYCSANILIVESDRCYRVEGAVVALEEMPNSREWHLAVKKDGLTKYTFKAEKVMRPCSSNRYTHVRMVSLYNEWKLEFANHQDWIVFKDLYRQCADRDIPAPVVKSIPVPGVRDVSDYADSCTVPFSRPSSYISVRGDEFLRAMARKTANYDMDSEDEEWLSKFNNEFQEHVSEENFELTVDALEKSYYYNPYDCYDEKSVANWCQNLVSKEAVKAIHSYWMRKRKQKRSSLLRVFQSYQSQGLPPVPRPLLRKKRSFKRHPSQINRCKLPSVLQAIASEKDALEYKNELMKIETAKVAANKLKEVAIQKWKRAQALMENADLAVYRATMLIRIAEAAQARGGSVEAKLS